jgi:hypothetical protein
MDNPKKGDRVRVVRTEQLSEDQEDYVGTEGVIQETRGTPYVLMDIDGRKSSFYSGELELIKEEQGMQKSDLKTGMLVKQRDGEWDIVMLNNSDDRDRIISITGSNHNGLPYYNDDLTSSHRQFDIVTVAKCDTCKDVIMAIAQGKPIEAADGFRVLWTRESPQSTQLKTIIGDLEKQLADAKVKLGALNGN